MVRWSRDEGSSLVFRQARRSDSPMEREGTRATFTFSNVKTFSIKSFYIDTLTKSSRGEPDMHVDSIYIVEQDGV